MATVPNAIEILPEIWTAWGCTIVTDDRRQTDRQTDGRATANSEREREFTFANKTKHNDNVMVNTVYCSCFSQQLGRIWIQFVRYFVRCVQTQTNIYEIVIEMNIRQLNVERRTNEMEAELRRIQVRELVGFLPAPLSFYVLCCSWDFRCAVKSSGAGARAKDWNFGPTNYRGCRLTHLDLVQWP